MGIYWFEEVMLANLIRYSQKDWYKTMLNIMRKLVLTTFRPWGKEVFGEPNKPNNPIMSWIGKELYLWHSKLSDPEEFVKNYKKAREQDKPRIWRFTRLMPAMPTEISLPICWFILNKKGKVVIEANRDRDWVTYAIFKKVDGGYNVTYNRGEVCIPRYIKEWGKKWYRWIKDSSVHYEVRNGRLTKKMRVYRENRNARRWQFRTETKIGLNGTGNDLATRMFAKMFGYEHYKGMDLIKLVDEHMYPMFKPCPQTLAGRTGNYFMYVDNPADILRKFEIKPTKSLVKTLMKYACTLENDNIYASAIGLEKAQEYDGRTDLNKAAIVWYLTKDVNLTRDAMEPVQDRYMPFTLQLPNYKRMWKLIYKRFGNNAGRKLIKFICNEYAGDTVRMLKDLIKHGADIENLDWDNPRSLHDSAATHYNLLQNEELWKKRAVPFVYDDEVQKLHFLKVVPGVHLELPADGNDLLRWAKTLHNCAASYMDRIREKRTVLIGVMINGERTHLIETSPDIVMDGDTVVSKAMRIGQFKADYNSRPELEIWSYVTEAIEMEGYKLSFSEWDMPHEVRNARKHANAIEYNKAIEDAAEDRQTAAMARHDAGIDEARAFFFGEDPDNVVQAAPAPPVAQAELAQETVAAVPQVAMHYIYNPAIAVLRNYPGNNGFVPVHRFNGDFMGWQPIDDALPHEGRFDDDILPF